MHCPRCGQQQASEEIRFCSKCGFPLGLISEILANGGFLPQLADLYKTKSFWTKKNGVMLSVFWFIFFVLIATPFWGIMDVGEMAGITAILGIFGSLMILIASLVFLRSSKELQPSSHNPMTTNQNVQIPVAAQPLPGLHGANARQALPPQHSVPASEYVAPKPGSWKDTNDLVQPNSVTDETTKILANKETR